MRGMKKIIVTIVIIIVVMVSLSIVTSRLNNNEEEGTSSLAANDYAKKLEKVEVEPQVMIEENGVVISLESIDVNDNDSPKLIFKIENNGTSNIKVALNTMYVNGDIISGKLSKDVCETSKTEEVKYTIPLESLESKEIKKIEKLDFSFVVSDEETSEKLFEATNLSVTTK